MTPPPPRLISASRRTDIPAFYTDWFMKRIEAGFCLVPNPFNRKQVSRVSLLPKDLDVIVFWSRNPRPLMPHLEELDRRGFHYYFQYTLMDNPRWLDPKSPPVEGAIKTFRDLAEKIGKEKVIWRYDPMVFTPHTHAGFHREAFHRIAEALQGYTQRAVISVMDPYPKAAGRLRKATTEGGEIVQITEPHPEWFCDLIEVMTATSKKHGMEIYSCAEDLDLQPYGVQPGKCVDDEYITQTFGISVGAKKDPTQREECGCVISKDIGVYDTCLFGCQYCYATHSFEAARNHHQEHDPNGPAIVALEDLPPAEKTNSQPRLF